MKLLVLLAWRNLWRHPRRTFIILFAISFGVWSMLSISAFLRGMMDQQVNDAINNLVGHIQIHAPNYVDDPVIEHRFPPPNKALLTILNDKTQVQNWSMRMRVPAVINTERESTGLTLVGIDPEKERDLSFIPEAITKGRYLNSIDDKGIILGSKLVERLETRLGKRVVLISQDRNNEIAERGFRVVGIYDATTEDIEMQFGFIGKQTAQKLLGIQNEISEIALVTKDRSQLENALQQLKATASNLDIQTWETLVPLIVVIIKVFSGFIFIWYVVVFIAMGFGLVNTLLMAIFERTREFGLFQALGMKPHWIIGQVLFEALFLLFIGLIAGNLMAWFTLYLTAGGLDFSQYAAGYEMAGISSMIYPALHTTDAILANTLVITLGILASFYPAWRAARYIPVEAIKQI